MEYDKKYWIHKSIRDPRYGFIHLSERETLLIGTPFMHRLTRIKQLAHTYLVYPSAVHTRFEHSLGVLYMADKLCSCYNIEDERREIIRCATLLHDIGHGPFSHLFEKIMTKINGKEFTHEHVTRAIIKYDNEIRSILDGSLKVDRNLSNIYDQVLSFFPEESGTKKEDSDPLGRSILSGVIDADKLDYLRRDSFHTGSEYGNFDLERMLSTLTAFKDNSKEYPAIWEKGTLVLESFRLARYSLHVQVYQHHTRLIADRMFLRALESAIFKETKLPQKLFKFYGHENEFVGNLLEIDDASIYELILSKCKHDNNSNAFRLIRDLKNRRLFKRAYKKEFNELPATKRMQIYKKEDDILEKEIADKANVPQEGIICYKESQEAGFKGYWTFGHITESGEIPILYLDSEGKPHPYEDKSPITLQKEAPTILYIFTRKEYREPVSSACKALIS